MTKGTDKNRQAKPELKMLKPLVIYSFTFDPVTGRGNMVGNIPDEQALELLQKLVFTKLRNMKIAEGVKQDEA